MNVFGGEDRFWLGPEGGQYALYFKRGDAFDLDHWQVPEPIDWGGWDVASQSASAARFHKRMTLLNYSGTQLEIDVDRTVRLLSPADFGAVLGESPGSAVRTVAFESSNTITNVGREQWRPESGLVSVWILGCSIRLRRRPSSFPLSPARSRRSGQSSTTHTSGGSRAIGRSSKIRRFSLGGRALPQQDRIVATAGAADGWQLRRVTTCADVGAVHASRGCPQLRELDVGDSARALQGRRDQQLQRRPAGAGKGATRTVLRARDVLTGARPCSRTAVHARSPHVPFRRSGGRARSHRARRPSKSGSTT